MGRSTSIRTMTFASTCLLLLLALSSCSKKESTENTPAGNPQPETSTPQATTAAMDDPSIAAIVIAANDADIDNAKQAQSKTNNADVKQFAKTMIADHGAVNDKTKALDSKLNVSPSENDVSRSIKASQDSVRHVIGDKKGADFDRAYVDNEVTYHQQVLDAIDKDLLPNAKSPDLKQLLNDTRPAVAQHLEHAKQLQTRLSGTASR